MSFSRLRVRVSHEVPNLPAGESRLLQTPDVLTNADIRTAKTRRCEFPKAKSTLVKIRKKDRQAVKADVHAIFYAGSCVGAGVQATNEADGDCRRGGSV